jgi:hypothetical protein
MKTSPLILRSLSLILSSLMPCGLLISQQQGGAISSDTNYINRSFAISEDSLKLRLIELEIEKAEVEVASTDLLHRLIPHLSLSASYGLRDILFLDPNLGVPYLFPRDSYRLTISVPLSEIPDSQKHSLAELSRTKLQIEHKLLQAKLELDSANRSLKTRALLSERDYALEEIALLSRLLKYHQLMFEQGKEDFDGQARLRLQLVAARRNLSRLESLIQQALLNPHKESQQ